VNLIFLTARVSGDMEKEKIPVISGDGVRSRITVFRTAHPDATVVICMPAMGVRASFYEPMARIIVQGGLHVVTADLRGNGESQVRPGRNLDFGYHEMVHFDWPAIVGKVKQVFPNSQKVILGHSLGGQLSTLYMSAVPGEVQGLMLVACPTLYYRGWPFPSNIRIIIVTQAFRIIARFFGYLPGKKFGLPWTEPKTYIDDWAFTTITGQYKPKNSTVDYEILLPSLSTPVLALSFSDDAFAPETAVKYLCSKFPKIRLTHMHFTPKDIGAETLGHIGWVQRCEPLVEKMADWLAREVESK
jgi:predicted alpha/beta hydrolase